MRKVKEVEENLPKLDVPKEYQPLENVSLDRRRPPMTFSKESKEPIFLDLMNVIVKENGAKDNGTNSSNFHRHHKELSKVITGLKTRIDDLEGTVRILRSMHGDSYFNTYKRIVEYFDKQKEVVKNEEGKLKELKEKYNWVHDN